MTHYVSRDQFRKQVRTRYASNFAEHDRIAAALMPLLEHKRNVREPVHVALDFFFIQAYKSHDGVAVLAEHGLTEDAATLTRRLLEIGVQEAYIGADDDPSTCETRAGKYLALLWRETPPEARQHLDVAAMGWWNAIEQRFGPLLAAKARSWRPNFRDLFREVGHEDTYVEDYSLLSQMAHASPEEFILQSAGPRFALRSTFHVPTVLRFASRYYLGAADIWNRHFKALAPERIDELRRSLLDEDPASPGNGS